MGEMVETKLISNICGIPVINRGIQLQARDVERDNFNHNLNGLCVERETVNGTESGVCTTA